MLCHLLRVQPIPSHPIPFICPSSTCAAYFKRSMSSCVRPRLSSCMVGSEDRWGKALRSFSQHSSSRLGTASQILNREPVLLFSWMFTTPPWMYMQPAWGCREGRRERCLNLMNSREFSTKMTCSSSLCTLTTGMKPQYHQKCCYSKLQGIN